MSYVWDVKGREFVNRVFELGAERNISVRIDTKRGKGSHATLYYGSRKTVVKDRRKELAPGLLSAMIRQLGLDHSDFR
jgi:mRNA interferase HicA